MADESLRELERAWREGGQLEAGQRFLRELQRAGDDGPRLAEVRADVLRGQLGQSDLDVSSLAVLEPIPGGACYRLDVAGRDAVRTWKRLRKRVDETGYWPLLLGTEDDAAQLEESLELSDAESVAEILAAVEDATDPLVSIELSAQPEGEWPDEPILRHEFATPADILSGELHELVVLALLPTTEGAQAPAWLRFGGWNDCPLPAQHVQAMRRWKDRYGAEPLAITSDVVEMYVEHPPTDRRDAMGLARQQFAYCDDLVSQGTETLANLASGLLGGTAWYFWWD